MGTLADLSPEELENEIAWSSKTAPAVKNWWQQENAKHFDTTAAAAAKLADTQASDSAWFREQQQSISAREDLRLVLETATAIFVDQTSSLDLPAKLEDRAKRSVQLAKLLVAECKQ
jgi:ATP-dependent Lon protease